ncbi:MAG: hypothetical protein D6689_15055 [Deltaproteobacteria bacterium]|nr:MAG: hypothetical protein D6689_15055 [Deltaproteobacteria bacterium]
MPYRTPGEPSPRGLRPGGTSGGAGQFLVGLAMLLGGGYLFLDSVVISSYGWGGMFRWGRGSFGLSLVPMFIGVALLFFNGKSKAGWLLAIGGLVFIFAGVLSRMDIHFRELSLFDLLLILVLIAGGLGLVARSLKEQ